MMSYQPSGEVDTINSRQIKAAWEKEYKKRHGYLPYKNEVVGTGIDEDSGILYAAIDAWFVDDQDIIDASYIAFLDPSGATITWMRGVYGRLNDEHRGALDLFSRGLPIEQLATL